MRLSDSLQELVKALESGGYAAPGEPLKVESLEPVMRVVTFEDPGMFRKWSKRCSRLSRITAFLRLRSWSHMFDQAALNFEDRAKKASIQFNRFHKCP
jgi:hypothetical protein